MAEEAPQEEPTRVIGLGVGTFVLLLWLLLSVCATYGFKSTRFQGKVAIGCFVTWVLLLLFFAAAPKDAAIVPGDPNATQAAQDRLENTVYDPTGSARWFVLVLLILGALIGMGGWHTLYGGPERLQTTEVKVYNWSKRKLRMKTL